MPETKQTNFRLSEETLAEMDALCEYLGISGRAEVIRQAVRRMARAELGAVAEPPVKIPAPKPRTAAKRKGK